MAFTSSPRLPPGAFILFLPLLSAAAATPAPGAAEIAWNAEWQGRTLRLRPTLRCATPCRWRFELVTVDMPDQAVRQGGRVDLPAALAHPLGQLSLTPAGPHCRLRLSLENAQGQRAIHEADPCAEASVPGRGPTPLD